ncbi:MAG: WYL domain-containing protein [Lachnospiraceae bacterium]|nr:WYL domain-containing protein [Lachnospiraceae bacterium]
MELFQINKNRLLEISSDVVNRITLMNRTELKALTKEQIRIIFCEEMGVTPDNKKLDMLQKGEWGQAVEKIYRGVEVLNDPEIMESFNQEFLTETLTKKRTEDDTYIPIAEVPVVLTSAERQAFSGLLNDKYSCMMMSEETEAKLRNAMQKSCELNGDSDEDIDSSCWTYKEQWIQSDKDIRQHLFIIRQAILDKRCVKLYINDSVLEVMPYRLIYTPRKNGLFLLAVVEDDVRKIMLCDVDKVETTKDLIRADIDDVIDREKRILELQILSYDRVKADEITEDNREYYDKWRENVLERCFAVFSHLNKTAKYYQETDEHHISVTYYAFDEEEITKDVLALGEYVVVKSPESIIERIKAIL